MFIVVGFVFIDEAYAWPDIYSLLPVGGTALLLLSGTHPVWQSILSVAPLQIIGRLSYALYLVHWPIIVIYRYWRVAPLSFLEIGALAAATFAAAIALHLLIEVPFREGGRPAWQGLGCFDFRNRPIWGRLKPRLLMLMAATTFSVAITVAALDGLPHRISRDIDSRPKGTLSYAGDMCDASNSSKCQFGDSKSKKIVYVVGDSHVGNLIYGLDQFFREKGIRGVGFFDQGCLFLYGTTRFIKGKRDKDCAANVADAYRVLSSTKEPVILAGGTYIGEIGPVEANAPLDLDRKTYVAFVEQHMQRSLTKLGAASRSVLLVKQNYNTGIDTARCLSRPTASYETLLRTDCKPKDLAENVRGAADMDGLFDRLAARYPGADTIDPKNAFCDGTPCTVVHKGAFLFRDADHLTKQGSVYLIEKWRLQLTDWLETGFRSGEGISTSSN